MTKRQGYLGIIEWLDTTSGPIVLGFDGNHWNLSVDLEPEYIAESDSPWYLENRFFGSNKNHRLRDAFLDYLREHPLEYEEIVKLRPHGPLAVSYVRGSGKKPVEDRFDYVFVSDEIDVRGCFYNYEGAIDAGSDHAIVIANMGVQL